ncbi:major capsid protein [Aeromonas sp. 25-248]
MTAAQKLLCRIAGVTSVALLSVPAFAADADFDVSSLIAMLQLVLAAVALVGTTLLTIYAVAKGYKVIKAAF